jgi:hypothetical protein
VGGFKSFPVETDDHLYTVLRYVERNALRANLVGPCRGLALGEPVAAARAGGGPVDAPPLAGAPAGRLVGARQRAAKRGGSGGGAPGGGARQPVRLAGVAGGHGAAPGAGSNAAPERQAQENQAAGPGLIRVASPFPSPAAGLQV